MRGIAGVFVVVAACAPHFDRTAHLGRDGVPSGARRVQLGAHVHGVVTARGGDSVDWIAFAVDHARCEPDEVLLDLEWTPPRPGLRIALAVYDEHLHRIGHGRGLGRDRTHVVAHLALPVGHYFAKIWALREDSAGTYDLRLASAPSRAICEGDRVATPPAPPIHATRPSTYQAPTVAAAPGQVLAEVTAIDAIGRHVEASLAVGLADGVDPRWTGVLVDAAGRAILGSRFQVVDVRDHETRVGLVDYGRDWIVQAAVAGDPIWTAALVPPPVPPPIPPPPHAPVSAALAKLHPSSSGAVTLELDRGRADGVEVGWSGVLVHPSGVAVPGGRFAIIRVELHRAYGLAGDLVITDKDGLRGVVAPPPVRTRRAPP